MPPVVVLLAGLSAAFALSGQSGASDLLHRPLHLPALVAGATCPVSAVGAANFAGYGVAPGIGPGPAYPIGFTQPGSVLHFTFPPNPSSEFTGSMWSGQKVLWFIAPSYRGPILIRGRRLDAADTLRFDRGAQPPTELRIPIGAPGADPRYRASYTRLRATAVTPIRSTERPSAA